MLALDISAAFDTLDHNKLLEQVKSLFRFECDVLRWLQSYLSDRQQFVSVGGQWSQTVMVISEVAQGSVLGSLLFSMFTAPVGTFDPLARGTVPHVC